MAQFFKNNQHDVEAAMFPTQNFEEDWLTARLNQSEVQEKSGYKENITTLRLLDQRLGI